MGGKTGVAGCRQTVERRIRLREDVARRLAVAAAIRGMTESELVGWALLPHLAFELPELPGDVVPSRAGEKKPRWGAA